MHIDAPCRFAGCRGRCRRRARPSAWPTATTPRSDPRGSAQCQQQRAHKKATSMGGRAFARCAYQLGVGGLLLEDAGLGLALQADNSTPAAPHVCQRRPATTPARAPMLVPAHLLGNSGLRVAEAADGFARRDHVGDEAQPAVADLLRVSDDRVDAVGRHQLEHVRAAHTHTDARGAGGGQRSGLRCGRMQACARAYARLRTGRGGRAAPSRHRSTP